MPLQTLLETLKKFQIRLSVDDSGDLKIRAPKGTLDDTLLQQIKHYKPRLLEWLVSQTLTPITKRDSQQPAPLSFQQHRLWLSCQIESSSIDTNTNYHIPSAVIISGIIDNSRFEQAVNQLLLNHPILNSVFIETLGKVTHQPCKKPFIIEYDTWNIPAAQTSQLIEQANTWFNHGFDLQHGPLIRCCLVSLQTTTNNKPDYLLLFTIHHLLTDGWSNRLLFQELIALYTDTTNFTNKETNKEAINYLDYADWQIKQLTSGALKNQLNYWQQTLQDIEPLSLTRSSLTRSSLIRKAITKRTIHHHTLTAPAKSFTIDTSHTLLQQIRQMAKKTGVSSFSILLASYQITLYKLCHCPIFTIATPIANRQRHEIQNTIGFFVNTLPLKADFTQDCSFADVLQQCFATVQQANHYSEAPFEAITEALGIVRQEDIARFFEAAINYETDILFEKTTIANIDFEALPLPVNNTKFSLTLNISDRENISLWIDYNSQLFDDQFIANFSEYYSRVLQTLLEQPQQSVSHFSLLNETDQQALLSINNKLSSNPLINLIASLNRTNKILPEFCFLQQLFEEQVCKTPNAIAISIADKILTYNELNNRANQLALIIKQKVGQDHIIGLCLDRSLELSITLLAILKSGNAYLPIDSQLPIERINYLLADSACLLLITDINYKNLFPESLTRLLINSIANTLTNQPTANILLDNKHSGLFALIYTSGSTGNPKGVRVLHKGIINRLLWMQSQYPLSPTDKVLQKTPINFDVSIWELFWPLLTGARLYYAKPDGHRDAVYLRETIKQESISTLHFVPSMLNFFLETEGIEACTSLTQVFCSGEVLSTTQVQHFYQRLPSVKLHNLYGPTEASIDVSYYDCLNDTLNNSSQEFQTATCPIGKSIANTQLHILDKHLIPLPPGAIGELYIGGVGLAEGYHQQTELTQAYFLDNPYYIDGHPSLRLYKTGDLCRYLADGNLEFIARNDYQIKLRGLRIELGDIESQLLKHAHITQAIALVTQPNDTITDQQLIIFYTAKESLDTTQLRRFLAEHLPDYMLPNHLIQIENMPVTANGKADRKALLHLLPTPADPKKRTTNITEAEIQAIWQQHFKKPINIDANFFELGGHSLLASRIIIDIAEKYQVDIHFRDIFTYNTIVLLAAFIKQLSLNKKQIIPLADKQQPLPLSFQQQRLYLFQQLNSDSSAYNMPAAFIITGNLNISALEKSLQLLIARHTILHTVYQSQHEQLTQTILAEYQWHLDYHELSQNQINVEQLAKAHAQQLFDLAYDLPLRVALYKLADKKYLFCFCLHHIAGDALSLELIAQELSTAYNAFTQHKEPQLPELQKLPELSIQYADFAHWQQQTQQIENFQQQLKYWQQQLATAPELLTIPHDKPRDRLQRYQGQQISRELEPAVIADLFDFCQQQQITPFIALLSCYQLLLGKLAQQNDICVGIPTAGRTHKQLQPLIGFFVNSLIIRSQQQENPTVKTFLQQQKTVILEALDHQDIPVEQIIHTLDLTRSTAYTPIAQIGFNFLQAVDQHTPSLRFPALDITAIDETTATSKYEMTWICYQHDEGIRITVEYNTDLFLTETIENWLDYFNHLLTEMMSYPNLPIQRLQCQSQLAIQKKIQQILPQCDKFYALTSMQRDIYVDSLLSPNNRQNYIGFVSQSTTDINHKLWQQSLQLLYQNADTLRTCIIQSNDSSIDFAYQAIMPADNPMPDSCFHYIDHPDQYLENALQQAIIEQTLYQPYVDQQPLWRVRLHRFAEPNNKHQYLLVLAVHHAMFDGVSMQVIGHMMKSNYERLLHQQQLDHPANNFQTFVGQTLISTDTQQCYLYWQEQAQQLTRYLDFSYTNSKHSGKLIDIEKRLSREKWQQLKLLCRKAHTTPPIYFKTLFALTIKLIHHIKGDFYFSEVVTGRNKQYVNTLGLFFEQQPNVLPSSQTTDTNTIHDLFSYFSRYRKQLTKVTPLSIQLQHQLLPQAIPYLFNFYIMESVTDFQHQEEKIEHLMPQMDNAVNFITRIINDEAVLQLSFNDRQLDGQLFIETLLHLHQQFLRGKTLLSDLVQPISKVQEAQTLPFSCDTTALESAWQSQQAIALSSNKSANKSPANIEDFILVNVYGNPVAKGYAGELIQINTKQQITTDYIGVIKNNQLFIIAKNNDRSLLQTDRLTHQKIKHNQQLPDRLPKNTIEQHLLLIWCDILGRTDITVNDNFFELGGHSLTAMRIANRMRDHYKLELPLEAIFNHPTIATIACYLNNAPTSMQQSLPPMVKSQSLPTYPLSYAQQRLWLLTQIDAANTAYNIPAALKLSGALNKSALEKAIYAVIERQQSLRSRITLDNSIPRIVIDQSQAITVKYLTYTNTSSQNTHQQQIWLQQQLDQEASKPFDVSTEPLLRIGLMTLNEQIHILTLTLHHLIADAQSLLIIAKELAYYYSLFSSNTDHLPISLPDLYLQYQDYAIWQEQLLTSDIINQQLAYWKEELQDAPLLLGLPTDHPRPAIQSYRGKQRTITLPIALSQQLRLISQQQDISLFMFLLASYQLLLHLSCKQQDICIGIPRDSRHNSEMENLVGFFINALIIRTRFDANYSINEILEQVRNTTLQAFAHEHVPAEMVMNVLNIKQQLNFTPIVQAAFNLLHNDDFSQLSLDIAGLHIEALPQTTNTAKFELLLTVHDDGSNLHASFEYNADLFEDSTISQLAFDWEYLLESITQNPNQRLYQLQLPVDTLATTVVLPGSNIQSLTTIQRDLYLASLRKPDTLENSIGYALALPINLDIKKWQASLQALTAHYAILRAQLVTDTRHREPLFVIQNDNNSHLQIIDWSDETLNETEISTRLRKLVLRQYDLQNLTSTKIDTDASQLISHLPINHLLINNLLIKISEKKWYTVLACHHLMLDGMSFTLHAYHLVTNYFHLIHNRPLVFSPDNYSVYINSHLQTFDLPENIIYWKKRLQEIQPLQAMIEDKDDTAVYLISQTVTDEHYSQVKQFCRKRSVTPALYYQCLYGLLINLYCRAEDNFLISEFSAGRSKEFMTSMGCHYYRQLFIFEQTALTSTIDELFAFAKNEKRQSKQQQALSLLTQSQLIPENNLSFSYNFFHMPKSGATEGISFAGTSYSPEFEKNIDLRVQLDLGKLTLTLCYQKNIFNQHRFIDRLQSLSKQLLNGVTQLSQLSFTLADEVTTLTQPEKNRLVMVLEAIAQQALLTPNNTAIICDSKILSYKELIRQSNVFAQLLFTSGVQPGDRVLICLDRCIELLPAILGTIKIGACYIPVDASHPRERLLYMLEDSAAHTIIGDSQLSELLSTNNKLQQLNIDTMDLQQQVEAPPVVDIDMHDLLYIIYTSGSTGLPKGAMISHRNATNLLAMYTEDFNLDSLDTTLIFSSPGFDLTQKNLFALLTQGGTVVLYKNKYHDPQQITDLINKHKITYINCAPSAFYPLLDNSFTNLYPKNACSKLASLKTLFLGGEEIHLHRLSSWITSPEYACQIVNMYGPTECTDISTYYKLPPEQAKLLVADHSQTIPIGTPSAGVNIYILNNQLQPVPEGLTGELCISGSNVGKGYFNQRHADNNCFINNPFATTDHCKTLYCSGDLVQLRKDINGEQQLYFIARKDKQLKLHGLRIEPTEIQNVLMTLDNIDDALVLVNNEKLLAFVVSQEADITHTTDNRWRELLSLQLPAYMLPSAIIAVTAWPLTANGKIDHHALFAIELPISTTSMLAPRNRVEQELKELWLEALEINDIGITDNFFEAGGNSLAAIKLVYRVEQHFNIKLSVSSLFNAQTIEQLAHIIDHQQSDWTPVVAIQPQGNKTPIFAIHALGGMVFNYQPLAQALGNNQPFYGIQAYGFETEQTPFTHLDEMIDFYVTAILQQQANGPYQLLGHSFGGLIAVEVARKLVAANKQVSRIILIDSYMPNRYATLAIDDKSILKIFIADNFGIDISTDILRSMSLDQMIAATIKELSGIVSEDIIRAALDIIKGFQYMMAGFNIQPINLPILLFRAQDSVSGIVKLAEKLTYGKKARYLGWNNITHSLEVIEVAGNHHTMLKLASKEIAKGIIREKNMPM